MVHPKRVDINYYLKGLSIFLVLIGISLRFHFQFLEWSFNGDEVNLGYDIITHSYKEIFYPFQSRQSAPPLFLLLEKLFSEITKPYISLKILSFLASCTSLFLFNRILKKSFSPAVHLVLIGLFCFNPFIISNSLTLKQYTLDLMFSLIAVNYFLTLKYPFRTFLFFAIFCLSSNVGLFFCASYSVFYFIKNTTDNVRRSWLSYISIKKFLPYLLAPLPYLMYFAWFMNQAGAEQMKNYMVAYWDGAFMPMDLNLFKWVAIQAKVITLFFFSTFWVVGIPLLILFLISLTLFVQNIKSIFKNQLLMIITLYIITVLIHIFLSALSIYPFSDRLFLYLAPGIYLILGFGIDRIIKNEQFELNPKWKNLAVLGIPVCAVFLYFTYLPRKANDVASIITYVNSTQNTVHFTPYAQQRIIKWLEFTGNNDQDFTNRFHSNELALKNTRTSDLLIAVQSEKFGHFRKYSAPEPEINQLLADDKIVLTHRINGYAIYRYK